MCERRRLCTRERDVARRIGFSTKNKSGTKISLRFESRINQIPTRLIDTLPIGVKTSIVQRFVLNIIHNSDRNIEKTKRRKSRNAQQVLENGFRGGSEKLNTNYIFQKPRGDS